MVHIPPLTIETANEELNPLKVKRWIVIQSDFNFLHFTIDLGSQYDGNLKWDVMYRQWIVHTKILQASDMEILIPMLQKHIWEYDYDSYLDKKLPRDVDEVRLNLEDLNPDKYKGRFRPK